MLASGCSWIFVDAPPRHPPPSVAVECDREHKAVAADLAGFGGLLVLGLLSTALAGLGDLDRTGAFVLGGMAAGAGVFGTSGYYGMHQLRRCHSLNNLAID